LGLAIVMEGNGYYMENNAIELEQALLLGLKPK
jgi:hypothetical protein